MVTKYRNTDGGEQRKGKADLRRRKRGRRNLWQFPQVPVRISLYIFSSSPSQRHKWIPDQTQFTMQRRAWKADTFNQAEMMEFPQIITWGGERPAEGSRGEWGARAGWEENLEGAAELPRIWVCVRVFFVCVYLSICLSVYVCACVLFICVFIHLFPCVCVCVCVCVCRRCPTSPPSRLRLHQHLEGSGCMCNARETLCHSLRAVASICLCKGFCWRFCQTASLRDEPLNESVWDWILCVLDTGMFGWCIFFLTFSCGSYSKRNWENISRSDKI